MRRRIFGIIIAWRHDHQGGWCTKQKKVAIGPRMFHHFPVASHRENLTKRFAPTCRRPLSCRSRLAIRKQLKIKRARLSKSPFEAGQRQGARKSHRKAGMDTGPASKAAIMCLQSRSSDRIVIPIHGNQPSEDRAPSLMCRIFICTQKNNERARIKKNQTETSEIIFKNSGFSSPDRNRTCI